MITVAGTSETNGTEMPTTGSVTGPAGGASSADVIIVGSGLMGAAVARGLRDADPGLQILMIDGGPPLGSVSGHHLHDVTEPELYQQHNHRVSSGIQGFYTGTKPTTGVGPSMMDVTPGMYHLDSLGEDMRDMPSAAVSWNVGGMGVHWTAGTPTPWGSEMNPHVPAAEWSADLRRASELLVVNPEPFPPTLAGALALGALEEVFGPVSAEGRHPQPFPMAVNPDGSGRLVRTGPNRIFPALADPRSDERFVLVPNTLGVAVEHDGGRATGVRVRDVTSGATRVLTAGTVVVCADTIRTPQLLFASGIRPTALGRYLNEHVSLTGRVVADPERLGFGLVELIPPTISEWTADSLWVPHSGPEQPHQFQVMNSVAIDDDGQPIAYVVGLGGYVPTEIRAENRLEFSETETDSSGLPRITVHFDYTEARRRTGRRRATRPTANGRAVRAVRPGDGIGAATRRRVPALQRHGSDGRGRRRHQRLRHRLPGVGLRQPLCRRQRRDPDGAGLQLDADRDDHSGPGRPRRHEHRPGLTGLNRRAPS